ncbi:MAG: gliding motility-associated C-terminal domain-containing protein [Flavobacteriales bacterium]
MNWSIPNVISPNGDGQNDTWRIKGITSSSNSVLVFNRWGQVVLDATNYQNNWKASGLPDGTYFYIVRSEHFTAPATGTLTILGSSSH